MNMTESSDIQHGILLYQRCPAKNIEFPEKCRLKLQDLMSVLPSKVVSASQVLLRRGGVWVGAEKIDFFLLQYLQMFSSGGVHVHGMRYGSFLVSVHHWVMVNDSRDSKIRCHKSNCSNGQTCEMTVSRLYNDEPRLGAAHLTTITIMLTMVMVTMVTVTMSTMTMSTMTMSMMTMSTIVNEWCWFFFTLFQCSCCGHHCLGRRMWASTRTGAALRLKHVSSVLNF